MNVMHQCPLCLRRYFLPPGNPFNMHCTIHTETELNQMEEFAGPNFAYKDEGEVDPSKTGVRTVGAMQKNITVVRDAPPVPLEEEQILRELRTMYERVTEEKVDKRWGIPRLRKEIEECERVRGEELEPKVDDPALDYVDASNGPEA